MKRSSGLWKGRGKAETLGRQSGSDIFHMDSKYRNLYSEHYYKFKNNFTNWKVGNLSFEALSINIQTIIFFLGLDRHSCKLCMKTAEYFWTLWSSCL